jgi:hypothetical protein
VENRPREHRTSLGADTFIDTHSLTVVLGGFIISSVPFAISRRVF